MRTVLTVCAYVQRHYGPKGGVKDHSLPSTVRRLCSDGRQANLLMPAVFGSTLAAPGTRTSVDVRLSNGFFLAYRRRRSSVRAWRRIVHDVVIFTVSFRTQLCQSFWTCL